MNIPLEFGKVLYVVWHRTASSLDNTGYAERERSEEINSGSDCRETRRAKPAEQTRIFPLRRVQVRIPGFTQKHYEVRLALPLFTAQRCSKECRFLTCCISEKLQNKTLKSSCFRLSLTVNTLQLHHVSSEFLKSILYQGELCRAQQHPAHSVCGIRKDHTAQQDTIAKICFILCITCLKFTFVIKAYHLL